MDKTKLLSGRLFLTVVSGVVFAYCSVTKILTADVVATIVTAVFLSYFQRPDRNGGSNGSKSKEVVSNTGS